MAKEQHIIPVPKYVAGGEEELERYSTDLGVWLEQFQQSVDNAGLDTTWTGNHQFDASVQISNLDVTGSVVISGGLTFPQDSSLQVDGEAEIEQTLTCSSDVKIGGDVSMSTGTVDMTNDVQMGDATTLDIVEATVMTDTTTRIPSSAAVVDYVSGNSKAYARMHRAANYTVQSTEYIILFDTVTYDSSGSSIAITTAPNHMLIPTTGVYQICVQFTTDSIGGTSDRLYMNVYKNETYADNVHPDGNGTLIGFRDEKQPQIKSNIVVLQEELTANDKISATAWRGSLGASAKEGSPYIFIWINQIA
jgi:hypothetical protein